MLFKNSVYVCVCMLVRKTEVVLILKIHLKWVHCYQRIWQLKSRLPDIWVHYCSFVLLKRKVDSDLTRLWFSWNIFFEVICSPPTHTHTLWNSKADILFSMFVFLLLKWRKSQAYLQCLSSFILNKPEYC